MSRSSSSSTRLAILAVGAALAGIAAAPAPATPASGFSAVQQWKGNFSDIDAKLKTSTFDLKLDTKGEGDLYVTRNAIQPGGYSGWHMHPGPSLIIVTQGTITAYDSHNPLCTPTTYTTGATFLDSGDHAHMLKNETDGSAETVAVQILPNDETRRIDAPEPNNCSF